MSAQTNHGLWLRTARSRGLMLVLSSTVYLLIATQSRAQIASSYVSLDYAETELKYYSRGILRASGPPNTKPANGKWSVEELPANPDKFWKMAVSFTGDGFDTAQESYTKTDYDVVRKAGVLLNPGAIGLHIPAPHQDENPNNQLPELRPAELHDISTEEFYVGTYDKPTETFVAKANSANFGRVAHGIRHADYFAHSYQLGMSTFGGTTTLEAKNLKVYGKHDHEANADKFKDWIGDPTYTVRSDPDFPSGNDGDPKPDPTNPQPPRSMSFDAKTQTVTIAPSTINVLNRSGDPLLGLDPEFANDPLVNAVMQISPLQVIQSPDGFFTLSRGEVRIDNDATGVHLSALFDEISLADDADRYVGLLSTGSINYLPQEQVSFTAEMVDALVVPDGIDSDYTPLGLFFEPAFSLMEATNNFTQSAVLPLAMSIGGLDLGTELAADFDSDGDVDRNDLLAWQAEYGVSTHGDDFLAWQRGFGGHGHDQLDRSSSVAHGVPEPASMMLGLVALTLGAFCRR